MRSYPASRRYLKLLNIAFLDPKKYELVDIVVTDKKSLLILKIVK